MLPVPWIFFISPSESAVVALPSILGPATLNIVENAAKSITIKMPILYFAMYCINFLTDFFRSFGFSPGCIPRPIGPLRCGLCVNFRFSLIHCHLAFFHSKFAGRQLRFCNLSIHLTVFQQFFMCSLPYNSSFIQYQNLLCVQNRTDSLCYNNYGTVCYILAKCPTKRSIRLEIQCRKTIIKNTDLRILSDCSCNCQSLFLSTGNIRTALCNRTVIVFFLGINKLCRLCYFRCTFDLFLGNLYQSANWMQWFPKIKFLSVAHNQSPHADPTSRFDGYLCHPT